MWGPASRCGVLSADAVLAATCEVCQMLVHVQMQVLNEGWWTC